MTNNRYTYTTEDGEIIDWEKDYDKYDIERKEVYKVKRKDTYYREITVILKKKKCEQLNLF